MKKIRVLFISHSADLGGAERALLDILSNLNKDKYERYLLLPKKGALEIEAKRLGVNTFIIDYRYWLSQNIFQLKHVFYLPINIISVFKIKSLIQKMNIDVVYTNTCTVISGAIASKISKRPHIWSMHELIGKEKSAYHFFLFNKLPFRIISALSQHIIANSNFIKQTFPRKYYGKISTVYNGFNTDSYLISSGEKAIIRKKYGIDEDEIILSVIGTICDRKGQREAILAMPPILKKNPRFKLIIAGKVFEPYARYAKELYGIVKSAGLEKNIMFIDFMEEIAEIYKIIDILIVPSLVEPFGRVIVEAMLFGVPVIATDVGGIPEIIQNGHNGLLLESTKPEYIANAIFSLTNFSNKTKSYIEEGRKAALSRFNMGIMIRNIEKVLLETVNPYICQKRLNG